jgi:enamine deaminase RidA (YjgF/YER057c/UK114 family)
MPTFRRNVPPRPYRLKPLAQEGHVFYGARIKHPYSQEPPMSIDATLSALKLSLPTVSMPAANYVPYVISGGLAYFSGTLPMQDGKPQFIGKVGKEFTIEQGQDCAKLCVLNIISHLKNALGGDLGKVKRLIRLGVFVNSAAGFTDQPKVANGASDLMVALFGDNGKHARFAVGVSELPFGVAVEVDSTFAV